MTNDHQNLTMTLTTEHDGRAFSLQATDMAAYPATQRDLLGRGFDGIVYIGHSEPTGRQRKTMSGVFYRSSKSGCFVPVTVEAGRRGW